MRLTARHFTRVYHRLRSINERVFGLVALALYTFIYIAIIPFFAVFAKKKIADRVVSGWQPWKIRSDSLEDLKKQY